MSDTRKAVFLSYASQDAEAAHRLCSALRAAGVEVWFDQSELRGGDAWETRCARGPGTRDQRPETARWRRANPQSAIRNPQ